MHRNVGFVCGQALAHIDATDHTLAESLLAEIPTADLAGVRRGMEDVRVRRFHATPCGDAKRALVTAVRS